MKKTLVAVAIGFLLLFQYQEAKTVDTTQYFLKVKATNKFERSVIADTGASIEGVRPDHVLVIANLEEKNRLEKLGWILEAKPLLSARDFPAADKDYHNYAELTEALKKLAADNPGLVHLFSIGKSFEGRDIMGIRICAEENVANCSKYPAMAIMGGHHAREHLSVEVPLRFAQYLLERYQLGDFRIRGLLNTRDLQIVPAINPDGLEYDVSTGQYKVWRKSRRKNGDGTFGVDLNRNYGFKWGTGGSSTSPNSDTYMGTAPFSEPETQAVKNWISSNKNINILLSTHTFSELILYPWGHSHDKIQDPKAFAVHQKMAQKMAEWNHYAPEQSSDLYIASGDTTDWAYGELGIISFTFELDPANQWGTGGFYPGAGVIPDVVEKNKEPFLYMLEYSDDPYRVL